MLGADCQAMVRRWLGAHLLPWVTGVLPRLGLSVRERLALVPLPCPARGRASAPVCQGEGGP